MPRLQRASLPALSSPRPTAWLPLALLAALITSPLMAADEPAARPPAAPVLPVDPAREPAPADAAPGVAPRAFSTPELAARCLFDALAANDDATLHAMTGPGAEDLVLDGKDPVVRGERAALAAAARVRLELVPGADGNVVPVVGTTAYPLPLHFARRSGGWCMDAEACRREMNARRIGEHELEALGVCLAYADAQVAYAAQDRDADGVKEYAQRLVSTPGSRDGLSWDAEADEDASPAGPELLELGTPPSGAPDAAPGAVPHVAVTGAPEGYRWRILTAQGAHAPGGAYSYIINGHMIAGFALLGVPTQHRATGVKSFIVSHNGKVYEKDLGPDTLTLAAALKEFDCDSSWSEVDEATLASASAPSVEGLHGRDDPRAPSSERAGAAVPAGLGTPGAGAVSPPCPPRR